MLKPLSADPRLRNLRLVAKQITVRDDHAGQPAWLQCPQLVAKTQNFSRIRCQSPQRRSARQSPRNRFPQGLQKVRTGRQSIGRESETNARSIHASRIFRSDVPVQQIFQRDIFSGFRSTDGRWTRKCQRQNQRTTQLRDLRQTSILTSTAHNDQRQSEFRRKLISTLHKLFVGSRHNDRHRTVQHRLQSRQRVVLFRQGQGRVRCHRSMSIPVPLSIQYRLPSQGHGTHRTARITRSTRTTRQGQQQMLSHIAGQQRTSRITTRCR